MGAPDTRVARRPDPIRLVRWIAFAVALVVTTSVSVACSGEDATSGGVASDVAYADDVPSPPVAGDAEVPCLTGGEPSDSVSGSATQPGEAAVQGGSPFGVAGARQVPGPNTTVTAVPSAPVSVVVAPPPNPDTPAAASITDGPGTPAPTYELSDDPPSTPSTGSSAPGDTVPPASGTSCSGGL